MKQFLLLIFLIPLISQAQPKTKQVLVEGNGQPIVLLHGGTFDITSFGPHSKLLADSFMVIRMQQFNVQYANEGRTLPKNYSVQTESEAVKATLDCLHISAPVILVGHSYGGVIAFDFATNNPERIQSLVLVEAPLFDIAKAKGEYSDKMKQIDELTKNFTPQANITEEMVKSFRCKLSNCDTFDIRQHPNWPQWVKQKDRLRGLSVVPEYKIDFKKLHAFQKPVLVVTGTNTIEPNKIVDKLLSHEFQNAITDSLPGNHIAVYQNKETFVQILKAFLRNIP
ncbi:MAG: alpha/beta hydrolase [Ferruginibacter sp.]|nr:alpha/beta hydrolase [Ferruginibacter sp.]